MDTLTFNSNTYSGTYTTCNNGVPCTFTVVVRTLSPTVGDNLTLARINNRNVYIQDSANNNQYIVTLAYIPLHYKIKRIPYGILFILLLILIRIIFITINSKGTTKYQKET